jgi:hypothetical protein
MKILSILGQDEKSIEEKKIKRAGNAMRRNQEALIDKIESELDVLTDKKEALECVTIKNVNTDTWASDYQEVKVNHALKSKELELANETLNEFFKETQKEK